MSQEIIIISAISKNNVIGIKNKIPWYIKKDFEHFKELTLDNPIIMGRKTWESLPIKPLPKRRNIVLTRDVNLDLPGVEVCDSFESALKLCEGEKKVFIIGGSNIYSQGLKYANVLELTRIDKEYEGDSFFPEINLEEWKIVSKKELIDEKEGKYFFERYEKV